MVLNQRFYSTTIKILDENENVLDITSINRNNDVGYYNNTYTYTDTITHNDTGGPENGISNDGIDSETIQQVDRSSIYLLGDKFNCHIIRY